MASRPELPHDVQSALERGDFLAAIRLLRERTGVDLSTARQVIDQRRRGAARSPSAAPPRPGTDTGFDAAPPPLPGGGPSDLAPGEVPRTRSKVGAVVVVLLLAWLLWRIAARQFAG